MLLAGAFQVHSFSSMSSILQHLLWNFAINYESIMINVSIVISVYFKNKEEGFFVPTFLGKRCKCQVWMQFKPRAILHESFSKVCCNIVRRYLVYLLLYDAYLEKLANQQKSLKNTLEILMFLYSWNASC